MESNPVLVEIEWTQSPTLAQDKKLASKIMDFAMNLLDDHDPSVSATLRPH